MTGLVGMVQSWLVDEVFRKLNKNWPDGLGQVTQVGMSGCIRKWGRWRSLLGRIGLSH